MTGTLWHEALAALAFIGIHFLTNTSLRARIVATVGETNWLGLFSLASAGVLAWLIFAFAHAPYVEIWPETQWARWLPVLVMPFAAILIVCGVLTPSPTMAGAGAYVLRSDEPARGMVRVTRHPLMWGFALWALSHIPANGDAASLILMGSLSFLALAGMPAMDAKFRARSGPDWDKFAQATSVIPFAAILQGRNTLSLTEIGWWRIVVGLGLYVALFAGHGWITGVPLWPV